jgi:hypothetical protein
LRAEKKSGDTARGRLGAVVSRLETVMGCCWWKGGGGKEEDGQPGAHSVCVFVCVCVCVCVRVLRGSRGREGGREGCSSLLATALGAQT